MSIHDIDKRVQVRIANDGSEATLRITPDFPMEMLSIDVLRPVIEESGVEWNEHVDQRLRDLISQPPQADGSIEGTIAVATPVRHGSDGYVEWYVDEHDEQQTDEQSEQIDFYEQCAFVMVESGQTIGKVIEPDGGEDGRDVTGKTWQAKAGRAATLRLDDTIEQASDGALIAQTDGMLVRRDGKATISSVLEIPGYVDFSSGNIDFDGQVIVRKGVRDRFEVSATDNIEIFGLIEAASISTQAELTARGGMAGREIGTITTGSHVNARYLNQVRGTVGGNLNFERELIGCELTIGGELRGENGRIIGGQLIVTGHTTVGELGSEAGVPTELVLGTVPMYEQKIQQLQAVREKLQARLEQMQEKQKEFAQLGTNAAPEDREKQTALLFKIQELNEQINRADDALPKMYARMEHMRTVSLTVQKVLFTNVRLIIDGETLRVQRDVRGPLHISSKQAGEYICQIGEVEQSLRAFVKPLRAAA